MRGARWKKLLAQETRYWKGLIKQEAVHKKIGPFAEELQELTAYQTISAFSIECGNIRIALSGGSQYLWKWRWETSWKPFTDIDYADGHVWVTREDAGNPYRSVLECISLEGKVVWRKDYVSDQGVIKKGLC